jgi:anti-anti-sigma factor
MGPTPPDIQESEETPERRTPVNGEALDESRPRPRLSIELTRTARAAVITLTGELDVVCADAFKRRFADAIEDEPSHVVIDLRQLTFLDSTGLALLLRVNEMSQDQGFALWVVSCEDDPPGKIFRLTGTAKILPLVDEPPEFV